MSTPACLPVSRKWWGRSESRTDRQRGVTPYPDGAAWRRPPDNYRRSPPARRRLAISIGTCGLRKRTLRSRSPSGGPGRAAGVGRLQMPKISSALARRTRRPGVHTCVFSSAPGSGWHCPCAQRGIQHASSRAVRPAAASATRSPPHGLPNGCGGGAGSAVARRTRFRRLVRSINLAARQRVGASAIRHPQHRRKSGRNFPAGRRRSAWQWRSACPAGASSMIA